MLRLAWLICSALLATLLMPPAVADEINRQAVREQVDRWTTPDARVAKAAPRLERRSKQGWGLEVRTAFIHQVESALDAGGRLAVNRVFAQANLSYSAVPGRPLSVSLGYRFDGYEFSGSGRSFPAKPWGDVHTLSVGVPLFVPVNDRWFVLAIPTIRTAFEEGASWEDGVSGGGIVGASYKVNETLRIGPGIGVFTQIEDDPSIFPIVLVDWQFRRGWRLKTGRGLGATQGPGLFVEWEPNSSWSLALGGRIDSVRFRMDRRGIAPQGIGEERSFGVVLAALWRCNKRLTWSASVGLAFAGELRVEDRSGNLIRKDEYDAAAFFGLGVSLDL